MKIQLLIVILIPLLYGFLAAYIAVPRGRNPTLWFCLGAFFGFLGFLAVFLLPPAVPALEKGGIVLKPITKPVSPLIEKSWFYLDGERLQQGPFPFSTLQKLWKDGSIIPSTYVWQEGMENWKKLEAYDELLELLQ
ncbi:MAG: putative rane-associated protein [Chlamydiia bacterium]|nr:putative rane-associated protein [Chlamydiia bacterium]